MSPTLLQQLINPSTWLGAIFYAVVFIILGIIFGKVLNIAVRRYLDRAAKRGVDSTSVRFLEELTNVVVYLLAFLFYAHIVPALQSLGTAWLASLGVITLVVGLAAQSTLSNIVAGVSLILYRPFKVTDRIQIATPTGTEIGIVQSVDLAYTSICTTDGRRVVLSNSSIANLTTINLTKNLPHIICEVPVTIAASENIDAARAILLDIAKELPKVSHVNGCYVTTISSTGTLLTLSTRCIDPGDVAQIRSDVLEKAKAKFDAATIKLS